MTPFNFSSLFLLNSCQSLQCTRVGILSAVLILCCFFFILYLVRNSIEDAVKDVQSQKVDGLFIDNYANTFYHSREKLKTLLTVKKLELQRDVGVLFSKDRKYLADCLNYQRSTILRSAQTIIATYKVQL